MRPKPPVSPMMPGRSRSRRGCSEHMPTVLLMGYSTRMIWRTPSATSRMPSKQVARPWLRCGSKLADLQKVDCCLPRLLRWSVPRASPRPTQASVALALPPPGRRLGATLRPQGDSAQQTVRRVEALAQVFDQMGVLSTHRPRCLGS